jgi:hypothetical protein
VADESVVVRKSRPEKAGNRLEEKTGMTRSVVYGGWYKPKAVSECEGRKFIRRSLETDQAAMLDTSHQRRWDTLLAVMLLKAHC